MPKVTISQGEDIASLAHEYGHFPDKIWNHGNNASLKSKRKTPNQLMPGDEVFVPEIEIKHESKPTDAQHKFKRKGTPHKFRLQLKRLGKPRANEPYVLKYTDGTQKSGQTDGDGWIEETIPGNCKGGTLLLQGGKEVKPIRLGDLNPVEEVSGVQQRLNNLGFKCGSEDGQLDDRTRAAVRKFQAAHALQETGEIDAATQAKLKELHP